jgi:hypothetical protein
MIQDIRDWIKNLLGRPQVEVVNDDKLETLERLSDRPSHSTELWDKIADNTCPNCSSKDQLFVIARGGLAMNVACKECDACYWVGPVREFGAEKIS